MMMYGLRLDGLLLEKYDTPEEAYESAQFSYEETGLFHEVVLVHPFAKALND
jgi:hypothetical protein